MSEGLYTQKEWAQFRGPTTSDNYNLRIENLYKDLVNMFNKIGVTEESARILYQRLLKEVFSLARSQEDLEARLTALEDSATRLFFYSHGVDDTDNFIGTDYEVSTSERCYIDTQHGLLLLPKVESSSVSKLYYTSPDGEAILPSNFEARVQGLGTSADSPSATIDTSQPYNAVVQPVGYVWERNVIADAADVDGAVMDLYVRFPTDVASRSKTNGVMLHPFPTLGCDIVSIAYTTTYNVTMTDADGYVPLNDGYHEGQENAPGWIAPGSWAGDEAVDSGPKMFYFDPMEVTGLKIRLKQSHYFIEDSKYIYSYGLSKLDARYDKFLDSGKIILRFDAPTGETISDINGITLDAWNVSPAENSSGQIYDYRVIWETAPGSGVYTLTPLALSTSVWIELTLNKTINHGTPAISALTIDYS